MGLHAYCVVPAARTCGTTGIAGAPVRGVALPPLAVWTSEHGHRPAATLAAARAHDAVIRAAHDEQLTPVPLRFGQWFEDEAHLVAAVAERVPGWSALLEELAGTVELGVRVTDPTTTASAVPGTVTHDPVTHEPVASGTEYMEVLLDRHRAAAAVQARRAAVLDALRSALGALVQKEYVAPDPGPGTLLSVAYLVRRATLRACQAAIDTVPERFAELRFHVSGPWPPYSFVA
jgi:hypothetical protein